MPQLTTTATILRRSDFRESSRIVTVVTREHGRIAGLAKGAHRPDSPFLGRIDFLNEVRATFSPDRGGLRLLVRAELIHERRHLRQPERFVAASHLAQLADFAMPDGRPDPLAYDLLAGGLTLLERCPTARLPRVVLGLELRLLDHLGALPDLDHCSECGAELGNRAYRNDGSLAFFCRDHAEAPRQAVAPDVLGLLRWLRAAPGREWPHGHDDAPTRLAAGLPGAWLRAATELRPRWRPLIFA
ncbi:MAG: DNA repair protein RecO [bacterium]|nr:DNA repair protein RecO [bacterium]